MKRLVAMALAMLCTVTPAHAQWTSGNQLHSWCSDQMMRLSCMVYIAGVLDASPNLVTPPNTTNGQVADVVAKYLRDNPSLRHLSGSHLVFMAVYSAWPTYQPQTPK